MDIAVVGYEGTVLALSVQEEATVLQVKEIIWRTQNKQHQALLFGLASTDDLDALSTLLRQGAGHIACPEALQNMLPSRFEIEIVHRESNHVFGTPLG
jgi:hypothetical protein